MLPRLLSHVLGIALAVLPERQRARVEAFATKSRALPRRRLRPTTAGQVVLVLAFAVGFAAMNTGNNLLFFGWGLILSSILISGILSESTLQSARAIVLPPDELRADAKGRIPLDVENPRRLPAFGVELSVDLGTETAPVRTGTTFELRLAPGARRPSFVPWEPDARGRFDVSAVHIATSAPFGFFSKERRVDVRDTHASQRQLVVLPARIDTHALTRALWARLGERPAGIAGAGDELFSLRPFRTGDDPRRIAWRRAARTGRAVVREMEATQSRELLVDLVVRGADDDAEDAIATAGSLVEDLLHEGHAVGVRAPGLLVRPTRSPRQRLACLQALATWDATTTTAREAIGGAARIAVVARNAGAPTDADVVVAALPRVRPGAAQTRPDVGVTR